MRGAIVLGLTFAAAGTQVPGKAPHVTLQMHVFNGPVDVTRSTRLTIHRAGERSDPVAQTPVGSARVDVPLPPGLYDVQATHVEGKRVLNIQWALRLVVMPYPDEHGRHLEVINLQNGYGALEIRTEDERLPPVGLYPLGSREAPLSAAVTTGDYLLYVVPAGTYDLLTGEPPRAEWRVGLDVPAGRTRLYVVP